MVLDTNYYDEFHRVIIASLADAPDFRCRWLVGKSLAPVPTQTFCSAVVLNNVDTMNARSKLSSAASPRRSIALI